MLTVFPKKKGPYVLCCMDFVTVTLSVVCFYVTGAIKGGTTILFSSATVLTHTKEELRNRSGGLYRGCTSVKYETTAWASSDSVRVSFHIGPLLNLLHSACRTQLRGSLCESELVDLAWNIDFAHLLCVARHSYTYPKTIIRLIRSFNFLVLWGIFG